LRRHHVKAPFQETVLSALPGHRQQVRIQWKTKKVFSLMVVPALVDHSIHLRLKWAVLQQQDEEMEYEWDDFSNSSNDDDDDGGDNDVDSKYRRIFSGLVVPILFDHCIRLQFQWAINEADRQLQEV
jgi:hypothetical protein